MSRLTVGVLRAGRRLSHLPVSVSRQPVIPPVGDHAWVTMRWAMFVRVSSCPQQPATVRPVAAARRRRPLRRGDAGP
ncbi:MAG: hypothetical protein ACRDXX_22080 [Stackebrandtia sp.]